VRNLYKDDTGTWVKIQDVERALIDASPKGGSDVQMVGEVLVTVSGFTGSGKSAVAGEIEILCKALGLDVEWVDSEEEKRLTHADWTSDLELFKPRVRIVERNIPRPPMQATSAEVSE
jgi:Mrp family chromosome partitioning ATPase